MQKSVKDIGSMFHLMEVEDNELNNLKEKDSFINEGSYAYFYTGRHALFAVLKDILSRRKIRKIWMPRYFCHNVLNALTSNFENVELYDVDPFFEDHNFDINTFATNDDVVILNNYWGLKTYQFSSDYSNRAIIIEDHSHGWRSDQCKNSVADYAICSLRKTYPIPLGAIAWRPNGEKFEPNYREDTNDTIEKAYRKISLAFNFKREFLISGEISLQSKFLLLLNTAERLINDSPFISKPSPQLVREITTYIDRNPNAIKQKYLRFLRDNLNSSEHFKIIDNKEYKAFGLLLLFKDKSHFLNFKSYLINNNIYAANLWPNNTLRTQWQYFFNIHVDFRYTLEDMEYLATKINSWSPTI